MSSKKKSDQTIRAAGILLMNWGKDRTEFLLMRHAKRWDLPKGHCEKGETFIDAALRETEEETGIPGELIQLEQQFYFDLIYPVTYTKTGSQIFQKQVRYFLGRLAEKPKLKLTEHEGAEWFDWNPPHKIQTKTIDPLLAAVQKHLSRD